MFAIRFALSATLLLAAGSAVASQTVPYPGFPLDKIGHTVHRGTGEVGAWCAEGDVAFYRQPRLSSKLHYNHSSSKLYQKLHGHLGHGVNLGIVGYKQSIDFIRNYGQTDTRAALVFELDARHGVIKIKSPLPVDADGCADGYVDSVAVGSKLLIAMAAEFDTKDEYREFRIKTRVSVLWGLKSGTRVDVKKFKQALGHGRVKVSSLMLGASSPRLADLTGERLCNRDNLEDCLSHAQKVMALFSRTSEFRDSVARDLSDGRYFAQEITIAHHR